MTQNQEAHPYNPQEDVSVFPSKEEQKTDTQQQATIEDMKRMCCARLTKIFTGELMNERLMKMAGGDASRVAKNLTSFLAVIIQDDGGNKNPNKKKYLFQCTLSSLTACFLESMNMQLPFDSRNLVCMIIYEYQHGYEAELDISYKGFVNALNRHFRNAFVECKLVFECDKFVTKITDRIAHYEYEPVDPFAVVKPDFDGMKGGYCFFSYTDHDGLPTSRLVFLSRSQILKNRSRARQTYVWDSDPKAMGEKTCIREGARLPFAAIDLDLDIEEVSNRHYELEKPESGDRLKLLMAAQEEVVHGKKEEAGKPTAAAGDSSSDQGTDGQNVPGNAGGEKPKGEEKTEKQAGVIPSNNDAAGKSEAMEQETTATITDADFEEIKS